MEGEFRKGIAKDIFSETEIKFAKTFILIYQKLYVDLSAALCGHIIIVVFVSRAN